MAQALFDGGGVIGVTSAGTPDNYAFINKTGPYTSHVFSTANSDDILLYDPGDFNPANVTGAGGPVQVLSGAVSLAASYHTDFHFRIWVIPDLLNLSNPTIDADIPFNVWNTFLETATLNAINVSGSSVLTFDIASSNTIRDFQYRTINMRIGEGEATIDASVVFDFDVGDATLEVRAVVAETFPILPEVPVNETWEFKTDILTNYKGVEQRIALMPQPRVTLSFDVKVVDYSERRILYDLITSNIKVKSLVPMFQYASVITQTTVIGGTRLYFDPALTNLRVGGTLVAMNRFTREIAIGNVVTLHADGATVNSAVGVDVEADNRWYVVPAVGSFLSDDSGLDFGTQAGTFSLEADVFEVLDLQRPGSVVTINTFDSLPVIEKFFLITQPERFAYRREVLDGGVGAREMRSRDTHYVVKRSFKFSVDRNSDEMDYWREFFALIKGAQKPFLVSTQLPDLTVTNPVVQGTSSLVINEGYYVNKQFPLDAFKRIRVQYSNGDYSYHVVAAAVTDALGVTTISILPGLTDDPAYTSIERISFLHKMRASDKVSLEHYNDYSYVKFGARSTNN